MIPTLLVRKRNNKRTSYLSLLLLTMLVFSGCSALRPAKRPMTVAEQEQAAKVDDFVDALENDDWRIRMEAVKALGKSGNPFAAKPLIGALRDETVEVQVLAANSLLKLGEPAVPFLIDALKNEDEHTRRTAAVSLGKIGEPSAVAPLAEVIRDKNSGIRWEALVALGEIDDPGAIQVLQDFAQHDPDPNIRKAAKKVLSR